MFKKNLNSLFLITFGIVLYAGLMNLGHVFAFMNKIWMVIYPIILGIIFAFILNVPMTKIELEIEKRFSKKIINKKRLHSISLFITLLIIIFIFTLAITMVVPALIQSIKSLFPLIQEKWPLFLEMLSEYQIDVSLINEWVSKIDLEDLSANATHFFGNALNAASSTISSLTHLSFGCIIAIYILIHKSTLKHQFMKLLDANLNRQITQKIYFVGHLIHETYSKFILGQCLEAIILGILIFIAFTIFRLPYALLIGFLTTIFAFIPYVGAFASLFISALLIVLIDPMKMIISIIVYMSVQFIENQFIYPYVVGSSVGLDPLWTLLAALVGGKCFGLAGLILFIPLVAVIYELVRIDTHRKIALKQKK